MRTLPKRLLVTTLCVAVSIVMLAGVSYAARRSASSTRIKIEVEAELQPCGAIGPATSPCDPAGTPPEPNAEGEAERKKEGRNGIVKKDEFKGKVKIPVDALSPLGIMDEVTAEGANVRMILSRDDGTGLFTDFAECLLEFDEIEMDGEDDDDDDEEGSGTYAEYKVDVQIKRGAVQAKKGTCDVNLLTPGTQPGIPDAKAGDMVTTTLVDPADRTMDVDFLQGTFISH
jgi:hypothetical protein